MKEASRHIFTGSECCERRRNLNLSITELASMANIGRKIRFGGRLSPLSDIDAVMRFEAGEAIARPRMARIDRVLWTLEKSRFGWRWRDQFVKGVARCERGCGRKAEPNDILCRVCGRLAPKVEGSTVAPVDALARERYRFAPPILQSSLGEARR